MRNSSLGERGCAENYSGLKPGAEAAGLKLRASSGRGALWLPMKASGQRLLEVPEERIRARVRDKEGENPSRRKPKVSWGRVVRPGLAGP